MQLKDLGGICATGTEFRDVYETILMQTYIYERTEIGDIGHYSRKFHTGLKVFYASDILCKREFSRLFAWVESRFGKLFYDVIDGRESCLIGYEVLSVDA